MEKRAETWIVKGDVPKRTPFEVPLSTVTRVEVSQGLRKNVGKWIGYGALAGGALGLMMGLSNGDDDCSVESESVSFCLEVMSAGDKAAVFGLGFALLGGAVGALAGHSPTEKWEEASVAPPAFGMSFPNHGGFIASLTIRF